MSAQLNLSDDLSLPLDILTESTAVLAKKRAGKTNLGVVIVEEAYAAGVPVVVIDPKGDWYGIRAASDGSPKGGLPLPVFGGLHGDVPLEPTAGPYLADLVRERGLSCLLDVSEFATDPERRRFLTAFADRIYKHPSKAPMLLMFEEAHEYIPQMVGKDDAKMVGVFSRLVRLGGYKGLGVMMLSQRSASLNKNVLSQVDNMFMLRTGSPQDRAAVQAWMSGHGEAKGIVDSLPALATGEFWLWQPERGEPVKARARMRHTYDAGATPKIGETPRPPATLADVDLGVIATAMAATIEKAKADDPKELRRQLQEQKNAVADLVREREDLKRELESRPASEPLTVEVPALTVEDRTTLVQQANLLHQSVLDLLRTAGTDIERIVDKLLSAAEVQRAAKPPSPRAAIVPRESAPRTSQPRAAVGEARGSSGDGVQLRSGARRMVEALGRMAPLRLTKSQWGTVAKLKTSGGTWTAYLGDIRRAGLIDENSIGYTLTDAGFDYLGGRPDPMTPDELQDHYRSILRAGAAKMLDALIETYPGSLTRVELGDAAGIAISGGTFTAYLGDLTRNGLAEKHGDQITATEILMFGSEAAQR